LTKVLIANFKYSKMLDYALRIYSSKPNFDNEIARTSFAKGRVLLSMGELDAGATLVEEAIKMFRSLRPKDHRDKAEIHQSDFDELVTFWSQ
jgi:hypothetical protein